MARWQSTAAAALPLLVLLLVLPLPTRARQEPNEFNPVEFGGTWADLTPSMTGAVPAPSSKILMAMELGTDSLILLYRTDSVSPTGASDMRRFNLSTSEWTVVPGSNDSIAAGCTGAEGGFSETVGASLLFGNSDVVCSVAAGGAASVLASGVDPAPLRSTACAEINGTFWCHGGWLPSPGGISGNMSLVFAANGTTRAHSPIGATPGRRVGGQMVSSSSGSRFFLFGGGSPEPERDLWTFDVTQNSWTMLTASAWNRALTGFRAVLEPNYGTALTLYGRDITLEQNLYDIVTRWNYTGRYQHDLCTNGTAPSPRRSFGAASVDSRVFLFGGSNGTREFNDLYVLHVATPGTNCSDVPATSTMGATSGATTGVATGATTSPTGATTVVTTAVTTGTADPISSPSTVSAATGTTLSIHFALAFAAMIAL